jgi:hypothetical protein
VWIIDSKRSKKWVITFLLVKKKGPLESSVSPHPLAPSSEGRKLYYYYVLKRRKCKYFTWKTSFSGVTFFLIETCSGVLIDRILQGEQDINNQIIFGIGDWIVGNEGV